MKILLVSNLFPSESVPNGGVFVDRRIEEMGRMGASVEPWALGNSVSERWRSVGRLSTAEIGWNRLHPSHFGIARFARRVLRQMDAAPDIVVGHGGFLPPAAALSIHLARELGIPVVNHFHGSDVNLVARRRPRQFRKIVNGAGANVFVSSALRDLADAIGGSRTESLVIPNGVDSRVFFPRNEEPSLDVLFVGNLLPVKGADRLPEVFGRLASARPSTTFTIIGDGPLRDAIRRDLDEADVQARFLGAVDHATVAAQMRSHRVLVLPSRSEGWPCTILEAQCSGMTVVGTDVGGVAEAIGSTALVVDPGEGVEGRLVDALFDALDAHSASSEIVERAQGYAWGSIVAQELAVYSKAIARA